MACNISAGNGKPSRLHGGLYRYYREAGLSDKDASSYAAADWVHTKTPSFHKEHQAVVVDPNNEPELYYPRTGVTAAGEAKRMAEVSDQELHQGLLRDQTPFYVKAKEGEMHTIDAVRAKPSVLGYDEKTTPYKELDDVRLLADELSKRYNVPVSFITEQQAIDIKKELGKKYNGEPSFIANGQAYAVEGKVSQVHLIHEIFGHPFLEMLQQRKFNVYSALVNEVMRNEKLKDMIRKEYPEYVESNGVFTEEGKKEMILKALELDAANRLAEMNATGFKAFINRFWNAVKELLGINKDTFLGSISTVGDLTTIVLKKLPFNLGNYVPEGVWDTRSGTTTGLTPEQLLKKIVSAGSLDGRISFARTNLSQGKYTDSANPDKVIRRSSEFTEHVFGRKPEETDEEKVANWARTAFVNAGKPDLQGKVTLGSDPEEYTYTQLMYHFMRQLNAARQYGNVGHVFVNQGFDDDPKLEKDLVDVISEKTAPDGSGIVIQDAMLDAEDQFDWLWGRLSEEGYADDTGAINDLKRMLSYHVSGKPPLVATEYIIYDEEWGIGATADIVLVFEDGETITIDYKFGKIKEGPDDKIMKYVDVDQIGSAAASRLNIATMNMVFRNVMEKKKMPERKWKAMKIAAFRKGAKPVELIDHYDLQIYLDAISKWEAETHPAIHKKNVEAGLYKADNYFGETLASYKWMSIWKKNTNEDVSEWVTNIDKARIGISNMMIELNAYLQNLSGTTAAVTFKRKQVEDDLKELTQIRLELDSRRVGPQHIMDMSKDLSKAFMPQLNQYDVSINILVALKDMRNRRAEEMTRRKALRDQIHKQLIDDLKKEKGITEIKIGSTRVGQTGQMPYFDKNGNGFWNFLFIEEAIKTGAEGVKAGNRMRLISKTRDKAKYDALRPAEKAYVNYFLKNIEEAYNKSVGERVVKDVTGKSLTKAAALGLPLKWNPDDAMLYTPMFVGEEYERTPGLGAIMKQMKEYISAAFISDTFSKNAVYHAGLPVYFMRASDEMVAERSHSLNGEHIFETFMEHMDHVELMEDVYATAKGVDILMRNYENHGKLHYETSLDYLKYYIMGQVVGGRETDDLESGNWVDNEGNLKSAKLVRTLEMLRGLTTYTTMSFQPVLASFNGVLITSLNYKHAAFNEISKKLWGIEDVSFGIKELTAAYGDFIKLRADIETGNYENNKLYHMLKEWKWQPDNYDFSRHKKDMGYVKNPLADPNHALFMHTITEQSGNITILAAMLRTMKVKTKKGVTSVYDAYDVETKTDLDTGKKTKNLKWTAGVRGVFKTKLAGKDVAEAITGLTTEEIDHLKKNSARLTGEYRQDEKGKAEMNSLWNLAWQFKRFMKRYFKNMWEGRSLDATLGKYIQDGVDNYDMFEGEKVPVLKWERTISEGWARTVGNGLLCSLMYANVPGFKQLAKFFGVKNYSEFLERYKWDSLSEFQKANVTRAMANFLFYILSTIALLDYEDDDTLIGKRLRRMIGDMAEGTNLTDTLKSFNTPFPSINKTINVLGYGGQLIVSSITDDRNQKGEIKGLHNTLKQFGPTAAPQQIQHIIEDMTK